MKLRVNSVSQRYKDKLALDNINIEFSEGIWGFLDPNGADKTTLMQILVDIQNSTAGLDIEERRRFREYMVQGSADRIVIISTYIVSDIEFISNRVAMINDGRMICNGDTGERKNELAGKVWEAVIVTQHLAKVEKALLLTNYHNVDNNSIPIRYVADQMGGQGSKRMEPELSDYYLFMNQKQKEGA